jgi:hypothetical protein
MKQHFTFMSILLVSILCVPAVQAQVETEASPPQGTTLTVYDTGFALVRELRRIRFAAGENSVRLTDLPATVDPATVSYSSAGRDAGFDVLEQQFLFDLEAASRLLHRYVGRKVNLQTVDGLSHSGEVLVPPHEVGEAASLALRTKNGSVSLFPLDECVAVEFPDAVTTAYLQPTLLWKARAEADGVKNVRLDYTVNGVRWDASYELMLEAEGSRGLFSGRARIANDSGGDFDEARIRLVSTEQAMQEAREKQAADVTVAPYQRKQGLRYRYGSDQLTFAHRAAGLSPVHIEEVGRPVSLDAGEEVFLELWKVDALPVRKSFVYDGVEFDRFQRNRRNDWSYGTEFHRLVEIHLEFDNTEAAGLGTPLAPGTFRLYQRREDGTVDMLGEDDIGPVGADESGHMKLGIARGLQGERERTGYTEVVPLHAYEESFEIRLENNSEEEVEIRVVEHLYRWRDFEIVRADTEYEQTGEQTIEFRPVLKPGGRRSIHYTVRYTW